MDQRDRLGRYSLVRRVGAGGFATVWLAYDDQLDAEVAIKVLSENWIDEDDVRRRFVAEGRFLRRVESPHVVGVHDIGETEDGRPYLVLTYADAGSLAERIKAGPLDVGTVVDVVLQVGAGLRHLHDRGVLHRDVKPANVLFRSEPEGERAMLGDLGLGKSLDAVSQLTMPGGTPAYVAPEQVMGDRLDERADLYSLGAVAYAALTGQAPHGPISLGAVLRIDAPPAPMASLRPEVPAALDAVVRRALEPARDKRWPTLEAFLTALRQAHETGEMPAGAQAVFAGGDRTAASATDAPTAPLAGELEQGGTRRWRAWVVAILAAAVIGGAGGYGGYTFMAGRPVEAQHGALSVEVPRNWGQMSTSKWVPVVGKPEQEALLVTPDLSTWGKAGGATPGVFLGVVPTAELPPAGHTPPGCAAAAARDDAQVDGRPARTWYFKCGTGQHVYERFIRLDDGRSLQIQVQDDDPRHAAEILESASFSEG